MLRKILSFILASTLAVGLFAHNPKIATVTAETNDFDCTYSVSAANTPTNLGCYGSSEIITYTEEEAKAAGIPAGFSGEVLSVIGAQNKGVLLDFSHLQIPVWTVKSITFRVYVSTDNDTSNIYPEIRIPLPGTPNEWALRYSLNDKTEEWVDIVLDDEAYFNAYTIENLAKDGYLAKFELASRQSVANTVFYIDSIKVSIIEDKDAPVITYNGRDNVTIAAGQALSFDVSATDAVQGKVDVEMIWGDPSRIDENGNPLSGEHTLTFRATDYFGNVAERTITVIVTTPDTTAPTFTIPTDNICVKVGTTPRISVEVTDDRDDVTPTYTWSKGALDSKGKLTEGVHTLTISASDLSGNTTTKTITFTVTETGDPADNVIDEEELCKEKESEEESESEIESEIESESEEESIVESEVESESETKSESESEEETESEIESEVESKEETTSEDDDSNNESEEKSESKSTTSSMGCTGSMSFVWILVSCLIIAAVVIAIRRRRF